MRLVRKILAQQRLGWIALAVLAVAGCADNGTSTPASTVAGQPSTSTPAGTVAGQPSPVAQPTDDEGTTETPNGLPFANGPAEGTDVVGVTHLPPPF